MAEYPRQLILDKDTEEKLISYMEQEMWVHYAERQQHIDDLMQFQKDYWAAPAKKKATFPFSGAATVVVPLGAIAIESTHARVMTQMFSMNQLVEATAISPEWADIAHPIEKFMDHELFNSMNCRRTFGDCFMEAEKFGTMIGKVGYERATRRVIREVAGKEYEFEVTVRDGATFDSVSDSRFLMPNQCQNPQTAPWCGEEHTATPYEIMQLELAGFFLPGTMIDPDENTSSKLKAWVMNSMYGSMQESGRKFDLNQAALEGSNPIWPKRIDWIEWWGAFDIDQSNFPKEIIVHYHRPSRTIMSIRNNFQPEASRPYRTNVYFPVEHRWRGLGLLKMSEQFQRIITTQVRQRLDNATLGNMRMIKISKLSDYGPGEPVFPGKMWFLNNMDEIDTFQLGELYPSSYNNEQSVLIYHQQRSAVNELSLGMPQAGTPGTATAELQRVQEGSKRYDFTFGNFKDFTNDIITDVAVCIQQFGPKNLAYYDKSEHGDLVRAFFQMPASYIRDGILVKLRVIGQQQNDIVDRQNWQQISVYLNQYYTGLVSLLQPLGDPNLIQTVLLKGANAITEAARQMLQSFDVKNIDRLLVTEIEQQVRNGLNQLRTGQGGNPGFANSQQVPGMDIISQALQTIGNGGNRGVNLLSSGSPQ